MLAARLHAYEAPLSLDDVPVPDPGPGQVLVRVEGAGFCHSDLHVIDGEVRILPRLPLTLGHENAGVVAAVGAGVRGVAEGDAVVVYGAWGCGRCDYCVGGHEQLCVAPEWAGLSQRDGGYAEFLLVPSERHLVRLDRLTPREAAPLTDAALTPYRAVRRALPAITPDHPVLLIGVGGLGQYALALLRLLAGAQVIAVDLSEEKRAIAARMGATHVLDGGQDDLLERVLDLTDGHGVSAAFDVVGADATLDLAVRSTRPLGRIVQLGLAGGTARLKALDSARFEARFEVSLWGSIKELREVIALAEQGRLPLIPSEFVPLSRIQEAYDRVKGGRAAGRVVVTPG
ncbi:MAG: NAD(P)-dependent alcohol dehydrogenase [Planctomycetes bacterium]|nr:NAD(P)-dependent alcohol dehydrogenase [Planctomycetota bacterium]